MEIIHETENFIVEVCDKPHVDRNDGGHLRVSSKKIISDRTEMPVKMANEFIKLTN